MKKTAIISAIALAVLVLAIAWFVSTVQTTVFAPGGEANATGTISGAASSSSSAPVFDESVSDGTLTVSYPSTDFNSATSPGGVSVHSFIPPCGPDAFDHCIYYTGPTFNGTNFESAGVRIGQRADLTSESDCLTASPMGYSALTPATASTTAYSASAFSPVGGAATGHYASGSLYRLFYEGSCYEFETRVGQSQFENYSTGTIQKFTLADEARIRSQLSGIIAHIRLPSGQTITFPYYRGVR